MIGHRSVELHNNGDCWPPLCPICDFEELQEEAEE